MPAMLLVCAASASGAAQKITTQPLTAKPGESLNLVISSDQCSAKFDKALFNVSGADVTFDRDKIAVTNCSMTVPVSIAAKPSSRQARIAVGDKDKPLEELHSDILSIVDIGSGPIPPGLDPQVDVLWTVLSEPVCSDQFGVRLARRFFCVDVVLGNNSGYPLILAGVGFLRRGYHLEYREATSSYLTVRAVVQREQVVSARNITLRGLQAAGVTIAGFTPFSGSQGRRGRIDLWSTLFGTVLATAFDGLVPDRTVKQASNLDDAALRDGRLIQNNSPTRFMVFVDRETIRPLLIRSLAELENELNELSAEHNLIADRADPAAELKKARIKAQKSTLEVQKQSTSVQKGKAQMKTTKNPLGRSAAVLEKDLVAVRLALGSLIVVGDQIEYKQRIQVDSAAVNPEIQPSPQVNNVQGSLERDKDSDIQLLGKNLQHAMITLLDCSNSSFDTPQVDPAGGFVSLKNFKIKDDCTESKVKLAVNTGGGTPKIVTLAVKLQVPSLDEFEGASSGSAASDGSLTLTLKGKYLAKAEPSEKSSVPFIVKTATAIAVTVVIASGDVPQQDADVSLIVKTTAGESNKITYKFKATP